MRYILLLATKSLRLLEYMTGFYLYYQHQVLFLFHKYPLHLLCVFFLTNFSVVHFIVYYYY
jgi:hypothetical protein